jgi:ribosome maturation factor RimP
MASASDSLVEMVRGAVESIGFELVGVEYQSQGRGGSLLRVYIDHAKGIGVEDCTAVSHQISGVLDVEDPIKENYNLEVSSPGLDRPLFFAKDFERFAGSKVHIRLRVKLLDRRRFEGVLNGMQDDDVLVVVDGEEFALPLDLIDKARLVPEFDLG